MSQKISRTILFLTYVILVEVVILTILRFGFWAYFSSPSDPLASATLVKALFIGAKYDLRLALLLILPILTLAWWRPFNLFAPLGRRIWLTYITVSFGLVLFVVSVHFGHYSYLQLPLDATILRFFENTAISMTMMWQTYPILRIFLAIVAGIGLFGFLVFRLYVGQAVKAKPMLSRRQKAITAVFAGFLVLFGLFGKFSYYPLRWSDAFFSPHPFSAAVAVNPVLYAFTTFKNKDVQFSKQLTQQYYDQVADYLAVDQPNKETLNYTRVRGNGTLSQQRPNVIMVILESFASYKTTLTGNPLDPTPHFKAIADNSVYFDQFYTPHTGTARSVFASVTGLPDIETRKTSTRNPLIVNQHTIIDDFTGYQRFYFIGGSASWGNIRGLLSSNIKNLRLYEEGSYTSPRIDVWGISDLDLFQEANDVLKKLPQDQAFFAVVQTSGNHRPYTIPDDNGGFQPSTLSDADVKPHGFQSVKEFDSFRFMDHSIGQFMAAAKKQAYYDNTIFVFFGDHGIHADTGTHVPKYEQQLGLHSLRVPLLIHAPKLLPIKWQGSVRHSIASELDILPTIAGLAAQRYSNTTLGRDLFDPRFENNRYAFTVSHGNGLTLGLLGKDYYFTMHDSGTAKSLYQLKSDKTRENIFANNMEEATKMETLCTALFETAKYMRFHNGQ